MFCADRALILPSKTPNMSAGQQVNLLWCCHPREVTIKHFVPTVTDDARTIGEPSSIGEQMVASPDPT